MRMLVGYILGIFAVVMAGVLGLQWLFSPETSAMKNASPSVAFASSKFAHATSSKAATSTKAVSYASTGEVNRVEQSTGNEVPEDSANANQPDQSRQGLNDSTLASRSLDIQVAETSIEADPVQGEQPTQNSQFSIAQPVRPKNELDNPAAKLPAVRSTIRQKRKLNVTKLKRMTLRTVAYADGRTESFLIPLRRY